MKNNYIKIILDNHNEFRTTADFVLELSNGNLESFDNNVKIDTGAPKSLLPIKTLDYYTDTELCELKRYDLTHNIKRTISRGIETDRNEKVQLRDINEAMVYKKVSFEHYVNNFYLDKIHIGNRKIRVNYDLNGNILIGMDILNDFDIHISKSIITGKTTMLACPLNQINDSYIQALVSEFGIGEEIKNSLIRKIDYEAIISAELNRRL